MSYVGRGHVAGQLLSWDTAGGGCYRWLPASAPTTAGQVLSWNGSAPVWITFTGGFTAGGDLSGTSTSQNVIRLQGRTVASTAPADGQALTWVAGSSSWVPGAVGGAGGGVYEYVTVAAAEAAAPGNNAIGFVAETDTFYRYMSTDASDAVRDAKVILNTGAGGITRWVAVAGRYGNIANARTPIKNNPTHGSSTNTFLGREALGQNYALSTGSYNVALGDGAGRNISSGSQNTFCGRSAGYDHDGALTTGTTVLGGSRASAYNRMRHISGVLLGYGIMNANDTRATNPIAIGYQIGQHPYADRPGSDVILIGSEVGWRDVAARTIAIGTEAAALGSSPGDNLCLGVLAGDGITTGTRNICIMGRQTFSSLIDGRLTTGSRNVFCGQEANSSSRVGNDNVVLHPYGILGGRVGLSNPGIGVYGSVVGGYWARCGDYAVAFGFEALYDSTYVSYGTMAPLISFPGNVAFGKWALCGFGCGSVNPCGVGPSNIGFGLSAGQKLIRSEGDVTAEEHIFFGQETAQLSKRSSRNIYFGYRTGRGEDLEYESWSGGPYGSDNSSSNIAFGRRALEYSQDFTYAHNVEHFNVVFGHLAGTSIRSAFCSTFLGGTSGTLTTNGSSNTCLGYGSNTTLSSMFPTRWTYDTIWDRDIGYSGSYSSEYNHHLCFIRKEGTWWNYEIPEPPVPNYQSYPTLVWYEVTDPSKVTLVGAGAVETSGVRLGAAGTTTVHGGAYTTDSDLRFKTAIEDCDLGLDFIKALHPRRFRMKASPQGPIHHGFIAQEVAQSLDGVESNIWTQPTSKDDMQAVSYEAIIAPLTCAVQELAAKVVTLRARIQILKNGGSCGPEACQTDA